MAAAAPTAATPPRLHDVSWELRLGSDPVRTLPNDFVPFTVGRWECALSAVHFEDAREGGALRMQRTRRLACTHANGTTVQSSLACEVVTQLSAPTRSPAAQTLPLSLDTAPPLALRCTPVPVERLSTALGTLCATPRGIETCTP